MRFQSSFDTILHLSLVCLLLLCSTGSVRAQTADGGRIEIPAKPDFTTMVANADVIVIGNVINVTSQMSTNEYGDQIIVSDVEIQPEEVLKGSIELGQNITLNGIAGGNLPDITMISSQTPLFKQADHSFLFFEQTADGLSVINGEDGKFDIDTSGNIPEISSSSTALRILILSLVTGSRVYLPLIISNTSRPEVQEVAAADQQTNLATTVPLFALTGQRWPGEAPVVNFKINNPGFNDAAAGSRQEQNTAIFNAANSWNTQSGANLTLQIDGDTTMSNIASDGVNAILVRNQSNPHAIAEAFWTYDSLSHEMLDCDIVFYDENYTFSVSGQGDGIDIQTVATHELGHCLGLEHSTVADSIMQANYAGVRQHLSQDDISGTRSLYRIGTANLWSNGFGYESEWRVAFHPRMSADVNGDDKVDVVGFGYGGVMVSLSTGAGLTTPALWVDDFGYEAGGWRVEQHPRMMADVNGDGKDDVVGFGHTGVRVALSTGTSFVPSEQWVSGFGYEAEWRIEYHPRMMADVNGDGKADVVGFGYAGVFVALSTGSAFTPAQQWSETFGYAAGGWRVEQHSRLMADVNGDGKDDVVGFGYAGAYVATSTGSSFIGASIWVNTYGYTEGGWRVELHPRVMADVTGDGKADVVGFGHAGVWVGRASNQNTFN